MEEKTALQRLTRWHKEDLECIKDLQDRLAQLAHEAAVSTGLWTDALIKINRIRQAAAERDAETAMWLARVLDHG